MDTTEIIIDEKIFKDNPDASKHLATVTKYWEEAEKANESRIERMRKNEDLYFNRVDVKSRETKLKINLVWSTINTQMPIFSDFMPTFDVTPQEENDIVFADMMQSRKLQIERQVRFKKKALLAVKDSLIYGDGILGIIPKIEEEENENGETVKKFSGIDVNVIDPFTWYPALDATGMDIREHSPFQFFATPMRVRDIAKNYNDIEVNSEGEIDKFMSFQTARGIQDTDKKGEWAIVKECFWIDENDQMRITTFANNTLLYDEPLDQLRIMYFNISNYKSAHIAYGVGEPEMVATIQKALNETMSAISDNVKYFGNPIRKIVRSWWQTLKTKITGNENEYIVNRPDDISFLEPSIIPPYVFKYVEMLMQFTDIITGVHDVTEGRKPTGITAASAIVALQEAAQSIVRFKIATEVTDFIESIGEYIIWILKTYDDEVRTIREKDALTGQYIFKTYDPVNAYDRDGNQTEEGRTMQDSEFEVEAVAGFHLPSGRAAAEERALSLWDKGIYGIERLAKALNETDKEGLIKEWYERQGVNAPIDAEVKEQFKEMVMQYAAAVANGDYAELENKIFEVLQQYPQLVTTMDYIIFVPDERKKAIEMALAKVALESTGNEDVNV